MVSGAAALALAVTLLLLASPGGALAQDAGAGRGRGKNVLKRSKPTAANRDRSILLEWRKGSTQLLLVWCD